MGTVPGTLPTLVASKLFSLLRSRKSLSFLEIKIQDRKMTMQPACHLLPALQAPPAVMAACPIQLGGQQYHLLLLLGGRRGQLLRRKLNELMRKNGFCKMS